MRSLIAAAGLLLGPLIALCPAASGIKIHGTAAYQYEDFGFTSDGMNGSAAAELLWPATGSILIGQDTVRRFEKTETQVFAGGRLNWNAKAWSFLEFLYSPRYKTDTPKVLPQWGSKIGLGFLPLKRASFEGSYKFMDYDTANSHAFSLGSEWYPLPRFYLAARVSEVATDFPSVAEPEWNTSYSFQPAFELLPEKCTLFLSYARAREPFEAGAPGDTRSFSADIYRVGFSFKIKAWDLRAGWEYEDRSNATFVRRTDVSLSAGW